SSRVLKIADKVADCNPGTSIVVGVPEVETWKFADSGYEVLVRGEEQLPFASVEMGRLIGERDFREIVLPVGIPRGSLMGAARWVWTTPDQDWLLDGPMVRLRARSAIAAALVLVTVLGWWPLSLCQRLSFAADGLGVVLGGLVARCWPRRTAHGAGGDVCHVIPSLGTGGTQRQVVEYLRRSGPGQPVHLIALFDSNDRFLRELERSGIEPVILARGCRTSRLGRAAVRFLPNTTALIALTARLRSSRPSCVVSWLFQANVIAASAARLAGVPRVVASVRNMSTWKSWPGFRRWWYWLADRLTAPLNDVIFANSQAAANDFVRWTRLRDLPVEVVPNGLDVDALLATPHTDARQRHGLPSDVRVLLTVGRLSIEKDHETLLRSCALLGTRMQRWHLLVVGHGVLETRLRQLADDLGLHGHVTFTGRVDDPQSYYRAATLFVLSSRIEGLPNALIEAQVFGLAAVTTDCGGAGDIVRDGQTGRVVAIGDVDALARNIEGLLRENETRAAMGRAAAEASRGKFDVQAMVVAIDKLSGRTVRASDRGR
ncbi:MAG: glycosyltransferase, partial [Gemmatimonadetes bacterium]|nr:glycosyltransferase [Gemmatimonadota bacterium]